VEVKPAAVPAELGMPDAMQVHFAYITAARDAVIAGKLERVRPALIALAATPRTTDVPADWLPWLSELDVTARQGAEAQTLETAARAIAKLASDCGECHRATRGGQGSALHNAHRYDPEDRRGLDEKMARHQFSADALWLGLTGPEHQAWTSGAAALMNIQVPGLVDAHGKPARGERRASGEGSLEGSDARATGQVGSPAPAGSVDLDAALAALRELGSQADRARQTPEKQQVFAQLITRCGACHASLGIDLAASGSLGDALASRPHKRVVVTADRIVINEKILFDFNAASIQPGSFPLLDELTAVLRANPQLHKISIDGHTDGDGDAAYNLKLSRERAAAVQRYLTEHGVEASRLTARGFGEERPIASNEDDAGKEQNRRVEFLITEQATRRDTYEVDPATGESRLIAP
jgi:outer membrane protein OmpA-like peptidoglycan-associated protein